MISFGLSCSGPGIEGIPGYSRDILPLLTLHFETPAGDEKVVVLDMKTGAIVSEENGVYELVGMMLTCSLIGLAAALMVLRIDRREGAVPTSKRTPQT